MEGKVECMYQDHLGLVTVGIGNLIDSENAAWATRNYGAPFVHKSDPSIQASEADVRAEWRRVKFDPSLKGNWQRARQVTTLQLTDAGIVNLLLQKMDEFEQTLKQVTEFFPLDDWPADAQLALLSMAWAMGPGFAHGGRWPNFRATCAAQDWISAVTHCNMANTWLMKRNAVNRGLFRNAAWVVTEGRDPTSLYIAIPGRRPKLELGAKDSDHAGQGFDSDDSVSTAQGFLQWLGFYGGKISGEFDAGTELAVGTFQQSENRLAAAMGGFAVDYIIGPTTWAALGYVVPRA